MAPNLLCCGKPICGHGEHQGPYHFTVNDDVPHPLSNRTNYIRTTKYTIITFIPLNLFSQFRRFYNLYFLLGAMLSLVKIQDQGVAPVSPMTQVIPLILVLGVTAIKDAVEDFSRYRSDQKANNFEFEIVTKGQQRVVKSRDLRPGDVIFVEKGQQFPADLIFLSSSQDDGLAYIETAELDGETNLKKRQCLGETITLNTKDQFTTWKASVECDPPDAHLYQYKGRLTIAEKAFPLNPDQLLLRGAILRNTQFVYGIVCYVGLETKIMKNLKSSSLKFSSLEARLNYLVLSIFVINFIVLLISSVVSGFWHTEYNIHTAWYIQWDLSGAQIGSAHAMTFYILYSYMIPISLFVTIELSRIVQALYMFWDVGMKSDKGVPMIPRNSNLNEDLGRIDHIFSDKTGTLTQNLMTLRHWYVNGHIIDETGDGEIGKYARGEKGDADDAKLFSLFLRAISVCHTIVPAVDEKTDMIYYEGDSPDEAALLEALRENDILFTKRTTKGITLSVFGKEENFEILKVIDFSSARKRMTIIVKSPEGQIELFCKGADNVILERQAKNTDRDFLELLNTAITNFSRQGLRTLLIAHVPLSEKEYEEFAAKYNEAETSIEGRQEKMEAVAEELEQNLNILGATAVEDKLQEDVAETIDYLLRCGIHVWMLTGDKLETAISIGKSTKFLTEDMRTMIVDAEDSSQTGEKLGSFIREVAAGKDDGIEMKNKHDDALVITGKALVYALKDHSEKFLELTEHCRSVICCRVSPLQKSQVVKLVRKQKKRLCLAIGDGANDVSMIQVANVGVGIIGLEGTQAVRASDFAFKEFRALRRLVAIHGRYSYIRMSKLILFSFYKNLAFIFPQFWAGYWTAWSGIAMYNELVLTCFNLVFTSLPPFVMAFLEKDIDIPTINKYPETYKLIRDDVTFNVKHIAEWFGSAFYQGLVLYFCLNLGYGEGIRMEDGREFGGFFLTTACMAFFVLTTVLIKWGFAVNHWHWPYVVAGLLSYCVFVGFMFIFSSEAYVSYGETTAELGMTPLLLSSPYFYLVLLFTVVTCLVPDLAYTYAKRSYFPRDFEILQESEVLESSGAPKHAGVDERGLTAVNKSEAQVGE